ncbi:MAG: hypothetical protein ACLSFJ_02955 [Holdemania filiformis]
MAQTANIPICLILRKLRALPVRSGVGWMPVIAPALCAVFNMLNLKNGQAISRASCFMPRNGSKRRKPKRRSAMLRPKRYTAALLISAIWMWIRKQNY